MPYTFKKYTHGLDPYKCYVYTPCHLRSSHTFIVRCGLLTHLLFKSAEALPLHTGIVMEAYSPLGSPARPWKADAEPVVMEDPVVVELAEKYGATPGQVCVCACVFVCIYIMCVRACVCMCVCGEQVHVCVCLCACVRVPITELFLAMIRYYNVRLIYVRKIIIIICGHSDLHLLCPPP